MKLAVPPFTLLLIGSLLVVTGCATVSPTARQDHTEAYQAALIEKSEALLAERQPLSLDDCLAIAFENNLDIKTEALNTEITELNKNIVFSYFLPKVESSGAINTWSRQPSRVYGDFAMPMNDKTLRSASLDLQMPLIVPSTWFLYSMWQKNVEIETLVEDYVRQNIALQVTGLYYESLVLAENEKSLRSQLEEIQALKREVTEQHAEGLVPEWQLKQLEAAAELREAMLMESERASRRVKGDLLSAMGLYPLGEVTFEAQAPFAPVEESTEALIYEALIGHPNLHIADRQVVMAEENVKVAIAEFFPKLIGVSSLSYSSESAAAFSTSLMGGISGVLTVFDGFENLQDYKIARKQKEQAYLMREGQCLNVMTQVLGAHLNEQSAAEYAAAAALDLEANEQRLAEAESLTEEGMLLISERLNAVTERNDAQMRFMNARYQHQLSIAVLRNALGNSYTGS